VDCRRRLAIAGDGNAVIIIVAVRMTSTKTGTNIIISVVGEAVTITTGTIILKCTSTGTSICRITYKISVV
jgi:hypothetical protein